MKECHCCGGSFSQHKMHPFDGRSIWLCDDCILKQRRLNGSLAGMTDHELTRLDIQRYATLFELPEEVVVAAIKARKSVI